MVGPYRIEGYVIASADGMIADAAGVMPASLEHDADKRYFEASLDRVEGVVHGRHSQEFHPNTLRRRRLILTRAVEALARHPANAHALLWNPAGAPFEEACAALASGPGTIAVIGGPAVYTMFLKIGYDAFHLCRAVNVLLPGGLPVFVKSLFCGDVEACLEAVGLEPAETLWLGEEVTLTDWTRASQAAAARRNSLPTGRAGAKNAFERPERAIP
jgi:dihydrofolate reductase